MTDYTPFQEPFTDDIAVLSRRTWEELRRIGTVVQELTAPGEGLLEPRVTQLEQDVANLQSRVWDLETIQQVLLDGVYGSGQTADLAWSPGTSSPTAATRIPIQNYTVQSNVVAQEFSIQPLFDADYYVALDLTFTGDQNNRNWTVAIFENGVQMGNGYSFNTRDMSIVSLSASFGLHMITTDVLDVRLWSTNAGSTGTVEDYGATLILLGLDDTIT